VCASWPAIRSGEADGGGPASAGTVQVAVRTLCGR
jgi:hypothetical protein